MRKIIYICIGVAIIAVGVAMFFHFRSVKSSAPQAKISAEEDRVLYMLGQVQAKKLGFLKLSPHEIEWFIKGLRDQIELGKNDVDEDLYTLRVQRFIEDRMQEVATKSKTAEQNYITKFVSEGATKTPSGLAYKILKPGDGKRAELSSKVALELEGRLLNGTIVDSTMLTHEQKEVALKDMIPGLAEGVALLKEGGEMELAVPSDLAYGVAGSPPSIPPGATLVFKVRLVKVH